MERVCIFIDGANLYHGLKSVCGRADIDFSRLISWLLGQRKLIRTYYYNVPISDIKNQENAKKQQRFFARLQRIPYFDIRFGRLEPRRGTFVEKGVDIAIAVDMLCMAFGDGYDTAILVSSDGDFAKAVEAVRDTGKHVEVAAFPRAYHIRQVADKIIDLTEASLKPLFFADDAGNTSVAPDR
ncbi:MAG: NYN domain-containing protein [Actinobacteria bacterium]|nr:NYN domain-containing protein [Actinomycetota bacterium]